MGTCVRADWAARVALALSSSQGAGHARPCPRHAPPHRMRCKHACPSLSLAPRSCPCGCVSKQPTQWTRPRSHRGCPHTPSAPGLDPPRASRTCSRSCRSSQSSRSSSRSRSSRCRGQPLAPCARQPSCTGQQRCRRLRRWSCWAGGRSSWPRGRRRTSCMHPRRACTATLSGGLVGGGLVDGVWGAWKGREHAQPRCQMGWLVVGWLAGCGAHEKGGGHAATWVGRWTGRMRGYRAVAGGRGMRACCAWVGRWEGRMLYGDAPTRVVPSWSM